MSRIMVFPDSDELIRNIVVNTPNILVIDGYDIMGDPIPCRICNMYVRFVYRPKNAGLVFFEYHLNPVMLDDPVGFLEELLDSFKEFKKEADKHIIKNEEK